MPRRAMSGAGRPAISRPSNSMRARGRRHQAGQRLQQRRLAGAVAAEQRDDFALAHVERGIVQDMALAVKRLTPSKCSTGSALAIAHRAAADSGGCRCRYRPPAPAGRRAPRRACRSSAPRPGSSPSRVGEAEHAVDVVFDDQDRNIGRDVLHQVRDASRSAAARPASGSSISSTCGLEPSAMPRSTSRCPP